MTAPSTDSPETARIQRLHEATSQLHACSTREAAYEVVIDAAVGVLGFDWCCLAEADAGVFELVAVSEAAPVAVGDRTLSTDEELAGEAYRTGEALVSNDAASDESAKPVDDTIRSGLSVPIGEWGVFQCAADERDAFDDVDAEVVELLLSHAAEAFRRIDNEAELRRQNERLDRFASVVSHDLRSPLEVARGRLQLYCEGGDETHAEAAESALQRMDTLIGDLLSLARKGRSVGETSRVEVAEAAEAAWTNVAGGTLSVDAERVVEADRSRLVQLFENLFRNSVEHGSTASRAADDAVEHGSTSPPSQAREDSVEHSSTSSRPKADDTGSENASEPSVADAPDDAVECGPNEPSVGSAAGSAGSGDGRSDNGRSGDGGVTITVGDTPGGFYVADDGPGIPPDERADAFEMGYSTAEEGTGFGLAIVEAIAEAHGWSVAAAESEDGGARFEVSVDPSAT